MIHHTGKGRGLSPVLTAVVVLVILLIIVIIIVVVIVFIKKSKKPKVMPLHNEPEVFNISGRTPDAHPHKPVTPTDSPHGNTFETQKEMCPGTSNADDDQSARDSPRLQQSDKLSKGTSPTSSSGSSSGQADPEHDGDSPPLYPPLKLALPTRQSTLSTDSSMTIPSLADSLPYEPNQTPILEDQDPLNQTHVWTPHSVSSFDEGGDGQRLRSESLASTITPPPNEPVRRSNRPKTAKKSRSGLTEISL